MDKTSIYKLAPRVLKRMEYGIDKFYLLNFNNDEIWVGNPASFLVISQMDGIKTIEEIINEVKEQFGDYTFEQVYDSMVEIIQELVEKEFLIVI